MYMSAGGGISLPFTAIRADSLSSLGPLHCAAQPSQPSLRPEATVSDETWKWLRRQRLKTCASFGKLNLNSVALASSCGGRLAALLMLLVKSDRGSSHWDWLHHDVLTLHAIKNTIKQRVACGHLISGFSCQFLTVTSWIETTKRRIIPAFVGVSHVCWHVSFILYFWTWPYFW